MITHLREGETGDLAYCGDTASAVAGHAAAVSCDACLILADVSQMERAAYRAVRAMIEARKSE